jgi:hypothetical protein
MEKTIVQFISELEMLGFLKTNGTSCRFVALTIKTPVVKIKVNNPWGAGEKTKAGLYKVSRKIGLINVKYNEAVSRRISAVFGVDVKYEGGTTWYEHLKTATGHNLPIVQHKDPTKRDETGYGLQFYPHKSFANVYVNEAGEIVPDETVKPYLYAESRRSEFKPAVIAPKLRNIVELKASGVVIQMPDFEEAEAILAQA